MPGSFRIGNIAGIDIDIHVRQQSLSDVLPLMAGRDVNQLPVVQNGTLVGIVSRDAIVQYLEVRRNLGLGAAKGDVRKQLSETDL